MDDSKAMKKAVSKAVAADKAAPANKAAAAVA